MKFPGGWQVDIVRPEGAAAYADINHGAEKYVVGVPGQPFEVRVTAPLHQFYAYPQIRVELTVEGQSSNVAHILQNSRPSATFNSSHFAKQSAFSDIQRFRQHCKRAASDKSVPVWQS